MRRTYEWATGPSPRKKARERRALRFFFDAKRAQDPSFLADRFWPDGMVRVSGREHNGLIESDCFDGGQVDCLTCHSMHSPEDVDDQLVAGRSTDEACADCHADLAADLTLHTLHPPESTGSRCVNCHMPHTVYGLLKSIRSHWIDSPRVETELATGRANACSLCHLDRPLGWVADRLAEGWEQDRPVLSEDQERVANGVRWLLEGNAHQRGMIAWHLGWEDTRPAWSNGSVSVPDARRSSADGAGDEAPQNAASWPLYYLGHLLEDPYPAVRYIASRALTALDWTRGAEGYDFLMPPDARRSMRERVMSRNAARAGSSPALLGNPDGSIDRQRFQQHAARRDDTVMDLRE